MQGAGVRLMRTFAGAAALACGLAVAAVPALAQNEDTQPPLQHMTVNVNDTAALRTGAVYFMHQCAACHSLQGVRFQELERPLGLNQAQIQDTVNISGLGIYDIVTSPMPESLVKSFLGTAPPDLTDEVKLRSPDWLYTYLKSFYVDPSRPTGVNNVIFPNVAMPDVFADLQGLQSPVEKMGYRYGQKAKVAVGVKPLTEGSMTPAQFDRMDKDIVTFLYYIGNPHQQESHAIGVWMLGLIAFLTILAYLIYRLYWRDVIRPHGERWWSYWKRR